MGGLQEEEGEEEGEGGRGVEVECAEELWGKGNIFLFLLGISDLKSAEFPKMPRPRKTQPFFYGKMHTIPSRVSTCVTFDQLGNQRPLPHNRLPVDPTP